MTHSFLLKILTGLSVFLLMTCIISCASKEDDGTQDEPITVSINDLSITEGDADQNIFVRIQLSAQAVSLLTVYISTNEGSAESNDDFIPLSNVPVVFAPGDLNKDYQVQIKGDNEYEGDETFEVNIVSLEGDATIDKGTAIITIIEDEPSPTVITIPTSGYSTPDNYPNLSLIWQDEFNGTSVDEDIWTFQLGDEPQWGNNELQYYRKENTQILDGNLVITAKEELFGGRAYTSSRLITADAFDFQYGRVDIRAAMPYGQGIWPALWMLGSNIWTVGWPACGEIDIMEMIGHQPATCHGTAHWQNSGQHASYGGSTTLSNGILHDEYHVYSIIWDDTSIRWLLDDVEYHVMNTTPPDLSEFHHDYFFIFNIAVGGNWPGNPNTTTEFPQHMIVDYIRVFQ